MEALTQAFVSFGPWDWACVGVNLLAAFAGIFALKCWRNLPGREEPPTLSAGDAALGLVTAAVAFALVFGTVVTLAAQAFSTHFGLAQAHLFTAAFLGQVAASLAMAGAGCLAPRMLAWKAGIRQDGEAAPAGLTLPRLALVFLCLLTLGFAMALAWKGVHFTWEQLARRGLAGEAPPDLPQDIVDSVLKTDVASWRFGTIVLAVAIGAPVMEELAFRGLLYPSLRRFAETLSAGHARLIAVLVTGLTFSLAHQTPSATLPLLAFGAFMCLVRDRYGLLTCMAAHACFNAWNLFWLKLAPAASTL